MKKISTFILIALVFSIKSFSQDPHFTQAFSNPLYLNPGFTGSAGCSRIAANISDNSFPNDFGNNITASLSYDQYVKFLHGGLGFNYVFDCQSDIIFNNSINLFYSYNIKLGKDMILKPGIEAGLGIRHFDFSDFRDISGPNFNSTIGTKYFFNAGAGIVFSWKNLVVGYAMNNIVRPIYSNFSNYRIPIRYTAHISYCFDLGKGFNLTPSTIYFHQQYSNQILPSLTLKYKYFKVGASTSFYNELYSIAAMIGFQNKWMSIGTSYNYSFSNPGGIDGGALELSTIFKFNCKNKTEKFKVLEINNF